MTRKEFSEAYSIARSSKEFDQEEYRQALSITCGCGLQGFEPVVITKDQMAMLIRYQAQMFNGHFDTEAVDELYAVKRKLLII